MLSVLQKLKYKLLDYRKQRITHRKYNSHIQQEPDHYCNYFWIAKEIMGWTTTHLIQFSREERTTHCQYFIDNNFE